MPTPKVSNGAHRALNESPSEKEGKFAESGVVLEKLGPQ